MPAKRRTAKMRDNRITAEAIEAFRREDWLELHRILGLKPWEASPLDATGKCPWPRGSGGAESWPKACQLREVLERITS